MRRTLVACTCLLLLAHAASAQPTVFVVRHAERADTREGAAPMMAADPSLSEAGRARAARLADVLRDASITAIFTTEYKRSQETAAPLAKTLGIAATVVPAKDSAALVARVKSTPGNVLVVGHSNTVPEIVKLLGVETPVSIGDTEYDTLFVVTPGAEPRVVRLHYR